MKSLLNNTEQKPVCIIVLGPHRCGTSMLSGILHHLGMDLPETQMPANQNNPTGYFESLRVMDFNDELLNTFGSDWQGLSPINLDAASPQVIESLMQEAAQIVAEEFSTARIPLLKDPRICRLVSFWAEVFSRAGYRPLYVHTHRNPLEAAASMQKRNAIPLEIGLLIWLRHVLDAEAATRTETRVFTNYKALLSDWRAQIKHMQQVLGFTFHRNNIEVQKDIKDFLNDALHHQHRTTDELCKSSQVADIVCEAFLILESWTGSAGNPAEYDTLDMLRHRLDDSLEQVAIFARAQQKDADLAAKLKGLEKSEAELRDENTRLVVKLEQDQEANTKKGASHKAAIAELEGTLRQRSLEAEEWFKENAALTKELKAAQMEKSKLALECTRLQEVATKRAAEIAQTKQALSATQEEAANAVETAKREAAQASERVEGLLASTSWKISAPLRWLVTLLRR